MEKLTNQEKFRKTISSLEQSGITPPIEVVNAIQDVFDENDNIDTVYFFFKDGISDLEEELTLENIVDINLNGETSGQANDVFTYYGEIDISLSEFTQLFKGEELIKNDITRVDKREVRSRLLNPDDYLVSLVETTKFSVNNTSGQSGTHSVEDVLRIYCPVESPEE